MMPNDLSKFIKHLTQNGETLLWLENAKVHIVSHISLCKKNSLSFTFLSGEKLEFPFRSACRTQVGIQFWHHKEDNCCCSLYAWKEHEYMVNS